MEWASLTPLDQSFFIKDDVVKVARSLIGKVLVTKLNDVSTGGYIVETEAYSGSVEAASHAFPNKRTPRTEVMFREGGISYVYLIYGMYHMFNVVTNRQDKPDAVLIRALDPQVGIATMIQRRKKDRMDTYLTNGPGKLAVALGIDRRLNGVPLNGGNIMIADGLSISHKEIESSQRIGVEYAGKDAELPWRFFLRGNKYVSR